MAQAVLGRAAASAPVVWENIDCPLCGERDEDAVIEAPAANGTDVYRVARCRACGMSYLNPRPDPATIGQFYPDEYVCYQASGREACRERPQDYLRRLVRAHELGYPPPLKRWYQKLLARAVAPCFSRQRESLCWLPYHGRGRLLEFGCGAGWFAHYMQLQGWDVTGLDMSAFAAQQVREQFGIPVLVGSLPHPEIQPESFDLVTMGMVLEHVHWPHDVIAAAARALRPGGLLAIVVPNFASDLLPLFGVDWLPLDLPRHLLHFTPVSLRRLVECHGMHVRQVQQVGRKGWVRRSFEIARSRTERTGRRRFLSALEKMPLAPHLMARWTAWTGQADAIKLVAEKKET